MCERGDYGIILVVAQVRRAADAEVRHRSLRHGHDRVGRQYDIRSKLRRPDRQDDPHARRRDRHGELNGEK